MTPEMRDAWRSLLAALVAWALWATVFILLAASGCARDCPTDRVLDDRGRDVGRIERCRDAGHP